jgi:hypothetical protein
MSPVEQLNFVVWATKQDPKFTLSRRAYTQAKWRWRTVVRNNPKARMVIQQID